MQIREEPEELLEVLTITASENLLFRLLILICLTLFPLLSKSGIFLEKKNSDKVVVHLIFAEFYRLNWIKLKKINLGYYRPHDYS